MDCAPKHKRALSAYVHFPWCIRKCPYCDFATRAIEPAELPHDRYAEALQVELALRAGDLHGRSLVSVFFGGGTPSLWEPRSLGSVLRTIKGSLGAHADLEVTVECNPSSLTRERAEALVQQGVTRLSVGVQSLDDAALGFLGRWHDAHQAKQAIRDAVAVAPRVSADVMFATPRQTPDKLAQELDQLLSLGVGHISAYALTIEPATPFGKRMERGQLPIATDDTYAELYLACEQQLEKAGLEHYEVSNYALPEQRSVHNGHYWRGGDYLGLGAAAVGCISADAGGATRWRNLPDPFGYMQHSAEMDALAEQEPLTPQDQVREALMLGLRTSEGVDLGELQARTGLNPLQGREEAWRRRARWGDLQEARAGRWQVPQPKWLQLDAIVRDLF